MSQQEPNQRDPNQPSEHEQRVTDELRERTGRSDDAQPAGPVDGVAGGGQRPAYEDEVRAEREGTTADEVDESGDVAAIPPVSYQPPRTG